MATTSKFTIPPVPLDGPDNRWHQLMRDGLNMAIANAQPTATRPPSPAIGQMAFDTTLGKPIWCKSLGPVVWVDATGTVV
jgi:hypothetical protein